MQSPGLCTAVLAPAGGEGVTSVPAPCAHASDTCMEKVMGHCSESTVGRCTTAQKGDTCFMHVRWAMQTGVVVHPEWYHGLSVESSFEEFQKLLRRNSRHNCPKPCPTVHMKCHTAVQGETCHRHVRWAMRTGIKAVPSWYPTLTKDSSFESFQARLHHLHHGDCPRPCSHAAK